MLREMTCDPVALDCPIEEVSVTSVRSVIDIRNNTRIPVYACDVNGEHTVCPCTTGHGRYDNSLVVRFRTVRGPRMDTDRKLFPRQNGQTKFTHWEVVIPERDLLTGSVLFLKEIGYTFGIDATAVKLRHPKLDINIEQRIYAEVSSRLACHHQAPVVLVANDPHGRIDNIYLGMGSFVMRAMVTNEPSMDEIFQLRKLNTNGRYQETDIAIKDILNGSLEITEFEDGPMFIATTESAVTAWVFRNKQKPEGYTKEELETIENDLKQHYERQLKTLKADNATMKEDNLKLNTILANHLAHESTVMKNAHDKTKMEHDEKQMQHELMTDQLKLKKEIVSANSSDITAGSNIVKAAAIIIPAVIGLAVIIAKNTNAVFAGLSGAWSVGKAVGGALWRGAKKVGGWIKDGVSWFMNLW